MKSLVLAASNSGLRNRCTGWLRLPRPADVMRMLLQRPLAEPRVHLYARKRLPAALTDMDSPANAAMRSVGGLFGLGQVIAVSISATRKCVCVKQRGCRSVPKSEQTAARLQTEDVFTALALLLIVFIAFVTGLRAA